MPILNGVLVGNAYPTTGPGGAILQDVWNPRGGWFSVQGATAFCQLQYGKQGGSEWTDEILLGNGAFVTLPPNCTGVRFRNGVANVVATVTAQIAQGPEPPLAIASIGSVTLSVASLNFQHNGLAIATEPTLDFEDGSIVFSVVDDPGNTRVKVSAKTKPPTQTIFSTGSGNYNPPAGCVALLVECIGGGGGGGGAQNPSANVTVGGGGGGGAYSALVIPNPVGPYAYQVGSGGGGGGGASSGSAGGASTFGGVVGANGGAGGGGSPSSVGPGNFGGAGGAGGSGGIGGSYQAGGQPGEVGMNLGTTVSGFGGQAARGGGGGTRLLGVSSNGFSGATPGGGGGGAASGSGSFTGGAGGSGTIVITEYY